MLDNLITSANLALVGRLLRASIHESGHAVTALFFDLPLRDALIRPDGTGSTRYHHHSLGPDLAESRAIVILSGAAAERDLFPFGSCQDSRDLYNIGEMIERFGLDWGEFEMGRLRFEAEVLVERLRPRIRAVAAGLVQHRHLTAEQIARYATV
jgi:hypothetical protein